MTTDIGIDLGTSKIVLFSGTKIVYEAPSVVTVDAETWEPVRFGREAYDTIGRTPESLCSVFPIEHGVIADYTLAEQMMRYYIRSAFGNRIVKPRVMVTMPPSGVTPVQRRSVGRMIEMAGGRNVCIMESSIAAAIYAGVDMEQPRGSMVIDIGAGTTDVATVSMGAIAACDSARLASNDFDEAIIKYVKKMFNIAIGKQTAAGIKQQIGAVAERPVEITMRAKGRNVFSGLPASFEMTTNQVAHALRDVAEGICQAVRAVLERTPPELVADIMNDGVWLTGGGALLYGMDALLRDYLHTDVRMVDDPLYSVVRGAGMALQKPALLRNGNYQFRSIQEIIVE